VMKVDEDGGWSGVEDVERMKSRRRPRLSRWFGAMLHSS
jgi:hypothetical protein